jgi:hypothetical protein
MAISLPFNFRLPPSGPNALKVVGPGNFAHNVLTVTADGKSVYWAPAGGGEVDSVFGRSGVVVAVAGDYDASEITNDSAAPGANVNAALTALATTPSFPPPNNAGNITGAANLSLLSSLDRTLTLTGNAVVTLTNLIAGRAQWFQLKVIQGGAGSFTLSIVGARTPGGLGLTLSTAVGAQDLLSGYWDGTNVYIQVAGLGFAP